MRWEELTAPDFAAAVKSTGRVCLLPLGVLEKHFDHLPLGTDYLYAHRVCCLAAEREPVVVFPPHFLMQINEGRAFPGAIAFGGELTLRVLMELCDEIARNGFTKIVLYNGHGGNNSLVDYFLQVHLNSRKPYCMYLVEMSRERRQARLGLMDTTNHGHACECETSHMLANFPELVRMDAIKGRKADPLGRFAHLPPGRDATAQWYSDFPDHYAGDAKHATAEKGRKAMQIDLENLVEYLAAVKKDTAVPAVLKEFYDRCEQVGR